jgi:16S rRNA (uracil1498-N3)-methyltransferase
MRTPRLYTRDPLTPGSRVQLQGQAGHYLSRVLRREPGDPVTLFNGDGNEYTAAIEGSQRGTVTLRILRCTHSSKESPLQLHLGLVMSKGDRMDWAVQKATELGVSVLTPLDSKFCDVKLGGQRLEKKRQHWQQVAISACEQCGRNTVPDIHPVTELGHWLQTPADSLRLMFDRSGLKLQHWATAKTQSLMLLVGPEGGFSDCEIEQAKTAGFNVAALGPRVMRTETVPVVALALVQYIWGDF